MVNIVSASDKAANFINKLVDGQTEFIAENLADVTLNQTVMSEINCCRANFERASLIGADFHKTCLKKANLEQCNLQGAHLDFCDLEAATLRSANLSQANLANASLQSADLSEANLSGANLANVCLNGAVLLGANLDSVNFSNTTYDQYTVFDSDFVLNREGLQLEHSVNTEPVNRSSNERETASTSSLSRLSYRGSKIQAPSLAQLDQSENSTSQITSEEQFFYRGVKISKAQSSQASQPQASEFAQDSKESTKRKSRRMRHGIY